MAGSQEPKDKDKDKDVNDVNDVKVNDTEAEPAEKPEEQKQKQKRGPPNAFSELMRKKAKPTPAPHKPSGWHSSSSNPYSGPHALGAYMADPSSPAHADAVVFFDENFVAVHDKFPKAAVHCLLLPRDFGVSLENPLEVLSRTDAASLEFLESLRTAAAKLARIAAADLARRFGGVSVSDQARQRSLREGDGDLPPGRDWLKDIKVGVHAIPSMSHLHVHVLSRDMHSARLRQRKHYNSFATRFFVNLDEFPLQQDDPRFTRDYIKEDMKCWRCGRNFGNRFAELKRHLDDEFEAWKRE